MTIETNVKNIQKNIKSIGDARVKLVDKIQQAALACILHSHTYGGVDLPNQLCVAVGAGMKHEALRKWMESFGPCSANADKEQKATAPMKYAKSKRLEGEALDAMMAAAAAKPWHDYKTEKPAEEFSFAADLHKLLGRLEKAVNEQGYVPTAEEQVVINASRAVPKPVKAKPQAVAE